MLSLKIKDSRLIYIKDIDWKHINNKADDYGNLLIRNNEANAQHNLLKIENQELKKQIPSKPDVYDAEYWNNKWKQSKVYYAAPKKKWVCEYVRHGPLDLVDSIAVILIRKHSLSSLDVDNIPLVVMGWLMGKFNSKEFVYKHDPKGKELWRTPEETLNLKYGDCDDYGILEGAIITSILNKFNCWRANKHRMKYMDGHVHHSGTFYPYAGRHFYLNWLHSIAEFMTVETTFCLGKAILNYGKKPQKLNPQYSLINHSFTEDYSHSQRSLVISERDYKKGGK